MAKSGIGADFGKILQSVGSTHMSSLGLGDSQGHNNLLNEADDYQRQIDPNDYNQNSNSSSSFGNNMLDYLFNAIRNMRQGRY